MTEPLPPPLTDQQIQRVRIRDVRSIWGPPLELELGERVTVLVGPNRAGTSNIAWAIALALDASLRFTPGRDLPRGRRDPEPSIEVVRGNGYRATVSFDRDRGTRTVDGPLPAGHVVLSRIHETPRDLLRALGRQHVLPLGSPVQREALAQQLTATAARVLPEVDSASIDADLIVTVRDDLGSALPVPEIRAIVALGTALHLAAIGYPPAAVIVEAPSAFLHPAAQDIVAELLLEVAEAVAAPVVITTTSPFAIPRVEEAMVVSVARDASGRTGVVGAATGDQTQARSLGGLLRDSGLAAVLDRVGRIPPGTRAVLLVEGGTDVAYLQQAAHTLGREDVFEGVVIQQSGGAMGAALAAVVLRAEVSVRVLVLLDHDDPGRRARDTLVSRFGFDRSSEVVTYADVYGGHPLGVEAETLFDTDLVRRFVREHGRSATRGERVLHGLDHVDLTPAGKSAFVGWLAQNVEPHHLVRWGALLDLLAEKLAMPRSERAPQPR